MTAAALYVAAFLASLGAASILVGAAFVAVVPLLAPTP